MLNIVLGCAQIGQSYGINNVSGPIALEQLCEIVSCCLDNGICEFDTALGYGDSHSLLGAAFKHLGVRDRVKVTTKINGVNQSTSYGSLEKIVRECLSCLCINQIENLLIHDLPEFKFMHSKIRYFEMLKDNGLISHFGLSLYDDKDLDYYSISPSMTAIQCPANLIDRRLLATLNTNVGSILSVSYRSILLQGLIFKSDDFIACHFPGLIQLFKQIDLACNRYSLSRLELFVCYMINKCNNEKIIIGIDNIQQLKQIISLRNVSFNESQLAELEAMINLSDFDIIDARKWAVTTI